MDVGVELAELLQVLGVLSLLAIIFEENSKLLIVHYSTPFLVWLLTLHSCVQFSLFLTLTTPPRQDRNSPTKEKGGERVVSKGAILALTVNKGIKDG